MKTKRSLRFLFIALVILAGLGIVWQKARELANLQKAAIFSEAIEANLRLARPSRRPRDIATPRHSLSPLKQASPIKLRDIMVSLTSEQIKAAEIAATVKASPEYRKFDALQRLESITLRYGLLFQMLDLTSEKAAQLQKLILDEKSLPEDINDAVTGLVATQSDNISASDHLTSSAEALANGLDQLEADIGTLLGPEDYETYKAYEANSSSWLFIAALQQAIDGSGASPLSFPQITGVYAALQSAPAVGNPAQRSLIPIPSNNPAPVKKDGYSFEMISPNSSYISPSGTIYSSAVIASSANTQISAALDSGQAHALNEVLEHQKIARELAAHYYGQ